MASVVSEELIFRQSPEAQAIIRGLLGRIVQLETELEELRWQVQGKTPQNSSLPPSTQHPHARPQPGKRKSKKKRGGQPGHAKHERPLIPAEDCDEVKTLKPKECRRCRGKLSGNDPAPLRHQVWELPEIKPRGHGVSTTSAGLPVVWRDHVCGTAGWRAAGSVGPAVDGFHGTVDGLLSSKQAADSRVSYAPCSVNHVARRSR